MLSSMNVDLTLNLKGQLSDFIEVNSNNFNYNSKPKSKLHPFISNFQKIWANNGDYISKHYAGTDSTTGDLTR
jgi:hypothetical protein